MFKMFRSLLNLFQIDGPINELLFWPMLLFLRGISKAICDLVLYILEETNSSITQNGKFPFLYLKTFMTMRCCTLSFVGSQTISLNSLAPIWCLDLSFKQKRIYLFRVTCIFFFIFLLVVPRNTRIVKVWLN